MLKIEYISVQDLKPYANNAKRHPDEQIEQIKASIQEFGFNDPIAVWKDDVIIEGHGRLIAAQELGIDQVPVIRLDELTDEQRRAYALAHNKLTMNSGFDFELLDLELEEISLDMTLFGFENKEPVQVERKDFSDEITAQYQVIIDCKDEIEQEDIYNKLDEEGYTCRVLTL